MKRQIVNIVNFIRAVEPRPGRNIDLTKPVKEQIVLLKRHGLKGTFLLQYDALIDPVFTSLMGETDEQMTEIGVWLEIVEPLAVKAGIPWRGRYSWDWHAHCGFTVGYTLAERASLIDTVMDDFYRVFHRYPQSVGSWSLDAHSICYLEKKYSIDAICICKDQWGTDGYNLWGGYYNQGYYPSRNNYFCPAQTKEEQIHVPVFRMLGSDPIYQYDAGMNPDSGAAARQPVITLEPICHKLGGGVAAWTDWYFRENFSGNCLSFGYTQVGQENSFGWDRMSRGLIYQFELLEKQQNEGKLAVETLGETGRLFKGAYQTTPASVVAALSDPVAGGHRSVWYSSKHYRINLYAEHSRFWIRDIHLFCEDYRERYWDEVCTGEQLQFDNLPVMDGNRWSGSGIRAGFYPFFSKEGQLTPLAFEGMEYQEADGCALISFTNTACGTVSLRLLDHELTIEAEEHGSQLIWIPQYDAGSPYLPRMIAKDSTKLQLEYNHFAYTAIQLEQGTMDRHCRISPEDNRIKLTFGSARADNA